MQFKQNNPAVSFLIATYNRAGYLEQCLESILKQSVQDFEIIIVDDCSSDRTEELIHKKYANKVIYHRHYINRGGAFAYNVALDYASGKYLSFINSDDILYSHKYIEIALNVFKADKNINLFCCDAFCINSTGNKLSAQTFFQRTIDHRHIRLASGIKDFDYVFFHGIHSCGAVVRKEIVKEVGFYNPDYKIDWDEDFYLRISAYRPEAIYYYNVPLTGYRLHSANISNNVSALYLEKIKCRQDILRKNKAIRKRLGYRANRRLAEQYLCLIDAYLKEGNIKAAITAIFKSLSLYPLILPKFFKHGLSFLKKAFGLKR